MSKKIIVKKNDGGIIILIPNENKYGKGKGKKGYSECKGLKKYIDQGLGWFLTDEDIDKSDLESRKQLYHDGDTIKKDINWELRLMPDQLIKRKSLQKNFSFSDFEKRAKAHNDDPYWLNKAIEGLDDRVSKGEADKPLIRQKINDRLNELNLNN